MKGSPKLEDKMVCSYCQDQIDNYESHLNGNSNSEETFQCDNCDLKTKNVRCLEIHKKVVHESIGKLFSCEMCNVDFNARQYLFLHKNQSHMTPQQKSEENNFDDDFKVKVEIVESKDLPSNPHSSESTKNKEVKFKCETCDNSFPLCE